MSCHPTDVILTSIVSHQFLYRLVSMSCLFPHPPPPHPLSLSLFLIDLSKLANHDDVKLQNACKGALFQIDKTCEKSQSHVMISYKWEEPSQSIMREIKKRLLTKGYAVWMDEEKMGTYISLTF